MDMIFGSMSAPDFFSHKSMREIQMDLGEVSEDSEGDDDYDFQSEDEDSFSSKHATKTPFSSRFKNQFIPNAESFRDPLKGRQSSASIKLPDAISAQTNSKLEASGVLTLLQTFDVHDIYERLHRPKRSETSLSIMSCDFSPNKEYLALGLSTGEIEVFQYDERSGSVRICYTLIDKDVNKAAVNCTTVRWMLDGRRIIAAYTNGFVKLWHVTSKSALVTRNENNTSDTLQGANENDLVNEVFRSGMPTTTINSGRRASNRQVHCVSYSRVPVTVDLKKWLASMDSGASVGQSDDVDYNKQVTLIATGGSDGLALVWLLYEPKGILQNHSSKVEKKFVGRQMFFNCACIHRGTKNMMDGHTMNIFALQFSKSDPTHFFSAGWDSVLFKWNAVTGERLLVIKGPLVCGNEALCMDMETDKPLLICGDHSSGYIDVVNFGDPDTLSVETRLLMPRDRFVQPYACCLFGIDKILVGGSNPNCLRIIDRNINPNSQQGGEAALVDLDSRQSLRPSFSQERANNPHSLADTEGHKRFSISLTPTVTQQGMASVFGSVEDLGQAVTCIALGPEDKLKKQIIAACSGSTIMFLNSTVKR